MVLTLKPEDERFIEEQVNAGRFDSVEDALAEAIDRLRRVTDPRRSGRRAGRSRPTRSGEGVPWEQVRRDLGAKQGLGE